MKMNNTVKKCLAPAIVMLTLLVTHLVYLTTLMQMGGDQATQMQTVRDIVSKHVFPIVGPSASTGNGAYHGAWYYYTLIPGAFDHFHPAGFTLYVSLLSVLGAALMWQGLKRSFNHRVATYALLFFTVSGLATFYTRWVWNPNLIPFYTGLTIFAASYIGSTVWGLPLFTFALAGASQMHISGIYLFPVALCLLPLLLRAEKRLTVWIAALIAFLIPLTPTIIEECFHGFPLIHSLLTPGLPHTLTERVGFITSFLGQEWQYVLLIPVVVGIVLTVVAFGLLIRHAFRERNIVSMYLAYSLFFSLLFSAFYDGPFHFHNGAEYYLLIPIVLALVADLLHAYTHFATLITLGVAGVLLIFNVPSFLDYANATHGYPTEVHACSLVRSGEELVVNGINNPPEYVYVCDTVFNKQLGTNGALVVVTDFKDQFSYREVK